MDASGRRARVGSTAVRRQRGWTATASPQAMLLTLSDTFISRCISQTSPQVSAEMYRRAPPTCTQPAARGGVLRGQRGKPNTPQVVVRVAPGRLIPAGSCCSRGVGWGLASASGWWSGTGGVPVRAACGPPSVVGCASSGPGGVVVLGLVVLVVGPVHPWSTRTAASWVVDRALSPLDWGAGGKWSGCWHLHSAE